MSKVVYLKYSDQDVSFPYPVIRVERHVFCKSLLCVIVHILKDFFNLENEILLNS